MSLNNCRRSLICLLTAHLTSAFHFLCLFQWEMFHFLRFEGLTPKEQLVERIVGPILFVFQFPGLQLLGLGDVPAMACSFVTGYLAGLAIGCFPGRTGIVKPTVISYVWWIAVAMVASDLLCICMLTRKPMEAWLVFHRALLLPVPVTLIASIALWVRHLRA